MAKPPQEKTREAETLPSGQHPQRHHMHRRETHQSQWDKADENSQRLALVSGDHSGTPRTSNKYLLAKPKRS
jgi:hypothetical protein